MKSFAIATLLLVYSTAQAFAQSSPLYICDTVDPSIVVPVGPANPFDGKVSTVQIIYYNSDFPGLPVQGQITDLYIRISGLTSNHHTPKGAILKQLRIKMGATALDGFPQNSGGKPKLTVGLTTVYYDSIFVLKDTLHVDDWWRLTLPQPYTYSFVKTGDSSRNLLIEFSCLPNVDSMWGPTRYFNTYNYGYLPTTRPPGHIEVDTAGNYWGGPTLFAKNIGFNPKPDPVGVLDVSEPAFTLHPNPTKDKLHIATTGDYTVYDMRGVELMKGEVKEDWIDVSNLPPGVYTLQMKGVGGARQVSRFVKE